MELGLATLADLSSGISPEQRMRDLLEEAQLAEEVGPDVFATGEHHRADFPEVTLHFDAVCEGLATVELRGTFLPRPGSNCGPTA